MTTVVNINTNAKYDVYIGQAEHDRDGYFGNPYNIGDNATIMGHILYISDNEMQIYAYRLYFAYRVSTDPEFRQRIRSLKDKTLGCTCKPLPCHGDVIANFLNHYNFQENE